MISVGFAVTPQILLKVCKCSTSAVTFPQSLLKAVIVTASAIIFPAKAGAVNARAKARIVKAGDV